ncbi:PQQ-binding-like beta-propeller repeat protein [Micromonospora halophytica]|uniref:Outer membrane protein assembly factor BamB, contains PQQ-like beta-propeller repeat n=1 Tax=Micromonospora halophytica TaxID=47864 RepID=A0A1C5I112_9ACTN|nr:PQQ-binding-like beta-propeller repeat protein [Micromonospora halophytica]SCG51887.1 Outer membrane protein assembly factor BamB, contains PQQ-like beta-propeller repeat [Micromonospora halophytica]
MTLIDLGDVRDEPVPDPRERPPRAVGRPTRIVAVLAVALLSLAGAAPPNQPAFFTVPAAPTTTAFVHGDRLFLIAPAEQSADRAGTLTAYAVPTRGRGPLSPLWWASLPFGGGSAADVVGDVLVVTADVPRDGAGRSYAFDVATGRPRWDLPGSLAGTGDPLLLYTRGGQGPAAVSGVDPATGRVRWSVPTPLESTTFRFGPDGLDGLDRIVLSPSTGPAEVWDARSGQRLVSRDLRSGELSVRQRAQPVGDLLLTVRHHAELVTAYGLAELDRRWEIRLGLVAYFEPCGGLICAVGRTGGITALDPATGETRWRATHWFGVLTERGGRVLVSRRGTGLQEPFAILDAATGRLVAELGSWDLIGWDRLDGRLTAVRPAGTGRLVFGELDVAGGRVHRLDMLTGVSGNCQAGRKVLLCRMLTGEYGVWRLAD